MPFEPVQFGKYKLIQPIAQGGMAEIFLARQHGPAGFEKTVVLKRILSHYSSHPEFVAMFLDEARLAAQLSHPNIVQIFDFGEAEGSYYLCMEYLRGEDLHTLIKLARTQGGIPAQVAATVVSAACEALHYAHTLTSDDGQRLNIVHRDISPSNIFLTWQGQVKVLDFGIARAEGKIVKTATGVIKGKLAYMAPEQARGQALDGRGDVWALGTTLHELLTGKRLFWRGNDVETFRALLDERIPPPSEIKEGIPAELDEVCAHALERDLELRYTSAKAMHEELDEYLSSRTYVPPQTLIQQYLQHLVGEEVIAKKMKSPTASRQAAPARPGDPLPHSARTRTTGSHKIGGGVRSVSRETEAVSGPIRKKSRDDLPAAAEPAVAVGATRPALSPAWFAALGASGVIVVGTILFFTLREVPPERPQSRPLVIAVQPPPEPVDPLEPTPAPVVKAPTPPVVEVPDASVAVAKVEPPRSTRGLLDVNCVPWCKIFLDGKDTGKTSPALGISLSVGKHRLKVLNPPTGVEQEKEIVIRGGATTREVVKF